MTVPDDEPHAIADTQMFRRFVEEGATDGAAGGEPKTFWMWRWPGLLVPIVLSVIVVGVLIALLLG